MWVVSLSTCVLHFSFKHLLIGAAQKMHWGEKKITNKNQQQNKNNPKANQLRTNIETNKQNKTEEITITLKFTSPLVRF